MEIHTKYFGKLPFSEEEAILFPNGLFGFENNKKYVVIRFENDNDSLLCLQNLEDESLAFIIINPFAFISDYSPTMSNFDLSDIEANPETPLIFYNICVIRENILESTVNLKCPLAVNPETRKAKQIILDDTNYSFRLPFEKLIKKEEL